MQRQPETPSDEDLRAYFIYLREQKLLAAQPAVPLTAGVQSRIVAPTWANGKTIVRGAPSVANSS